MFRNDKNITIDELNKTNNNANIHFDKKSYTLGKLIELFKEYKKDNINFDFDVHINNIYEKIYDIKINYKDVIEILKEKGYYVWNYDYYDIEGVWKKINYPNYKKFTHKSWYDIPSHKIYEIIKIKSVDYFSLDNHLKDLYYFLFPIKK